MTIRIATQDDLKFIHHLQGRWSNQIGFIPPTATQRELEWGHILFADHNDDDAGFLLVQPALSGQRTTAAIIQAAVRLDAQRLSIGTQLVGAVAMKAAAAGTTMLQCWCRSGIEANLFWEACGFQKIMQRNGGKSHGEPHNLWRLKIDEAADIGQLPVPKTFHGPGGKFTRKPSCAD